MQDEFGARNGITCFSAAWHDPVIWAHYSDKHKGLCLGFDLPEMTADPEKDITMPVKYVSELVKFPRNFPNLTQAERFEFCRRLLFTKYKNWAYEEEIRMWNPLQNKDGELHFLEFDETIRLVEIIVGARCGVSPKKLARALGSRGAEVKIMKARRAYDKFKIVEDERMFVSPKISGD